MIKRRSEAKTYNVSEMEADEKSNQDVENQVPSSNFSKQKLDCVKVETPPGAPLSPSSSAVRVPASASQKGRNDRPFTRSSLL